jgi:hypothetical protein
LALQLDAVTGVARKPDNVTVFDCKFLLHFDFLVKFEARIVTKSGLNARNGLE